MRKNAKLEKNIYREEVFERQHDNKKIGKTSQRTNVQHCVAIAISPLESPLSFECEEGKRFETRVGAIVQCVNNIQESI
jgi:hypothetical protein